jgi:hemolysin activation/secretion protein
MKWHIKIKTPIFLISATIVCLGGVFSQPGYALDNLEIGRSQFFEKHREKVQISQAPTHLIAQSTETSSPSPSGDSGVLIPIKTVEVIGSSIYGLQELDPIIKPLEGKSVTQDELRKAVNGITQLYIDQGYLNSRAIFKGITPDGVAQIEVIEGKISEVIVQGTDRLKEYVRQRVSLGTVTPLNVRNLEDQLRLLKNDPLFKNVEASLRAPQSDNRNPGVPIPQNESILIVRVTEANPFSGNVSIDNYSPPSVGATRLSLNGLYRNLTGIGDSIGVSYRPRLETISGTYRVDTFYQAPLNPMNGTIAASVLIDRNQTLTQDFSALNIRGNSERYILEYRQPIIRTFEEEFALSLGISYEQGQTFALDSGFPFGFGPNENGISKSSPIIFAQDYLSRSPDGAWALRSQFRFGTGLFGATSNPSPIPDGYFFAWLGQLQRLQVINENNLLIIQLDAQLTPDPLLPLEQFVIGGAQSVRGYRQNAVSGDNGFRFSIEDRFTVVRNENGESVFTVAPFFDMGAVWNASGNPNPVGANQTFLAGLGLGLIWQPINGLSLRLDYAPPLVYLTPHGNNIQDYGLYLSGSYDF